MKEKERDILDDLFYSKLHDFEADTVPEDWEKIAGRLPGKASVPFYQTKRFFAAAAVITLLLMVGSLYMFEKEPISEPIAQEIQKQTEEIISRMEETRETLAVEPKETATSVIAPAISRIQAALMKKNEPVLSEKEESEDMIEVPAQIQEDEELKSRVAKDDSDEVDDAAIDFQPRMNSEEITSSKDVVPVSSKKEEKKTRKWGFGMGAGSFSVSSNNVVSNYVVQSAGLRSESLMLMNSAYADSELPKTDIKHKTPISFGLGVSRYLNDRFALQTGLNYTYLSSEWKTNGKYHAKTDQKLHFLGIPVSLTYKIAEWNRFNFYASTGLMAELCVSGHQKTKLLREEVMDDVELDREKVNSRMKEPLFSANARVGVSYPLISILSAYGEVGAAYYFDNNSKIETIRSEKPFNVSFQVGLRLGF